MEQIYESRFNFFLINYMHNYTQTNILFYMYFILIREFE